MKTYGYCRVSTPHQSLSRQIKNIKEHYPEAIIISEHYSGTTNIRPKWNNLLKRLKYGDILVCDSISRFSRHEGFQLYEKLFNAGIELVFIKEPHLNSNIYRKTLNDQENQISLTGTNIDIILEALKKYMLLVAKEQIKLAFDNAEQEVEMLRVRTREGIEIARINGKKIGLSKGTKLVTKKSIIAKEQIVEYSKEFNGSLSDLDTMKLIGISRNTYYKYKRELKEKGF